MAGSDDSVEARIRIGVQDDASGTMASIASNVKQSGDQIATAISKSLGAQLTETDKSLQQIKRRTDEVFGKGMVDSFRAAENELKPTGRRDCAVLDKSCAPRSQKPGSGRKNGLFRPNKRMDENEKRAQKSG
jgi:hypothetical protein